MTTALHVEEAGSGPPLVCLHGFGASTYTWREVMATLSAAHHVYALDLKGFGQSPKPRDGKYSGHDQAALVREFIDERGLRGVTLVGHSFGGGVALLTALELIRTSPGVLAGLVLLDAASYRQRMPIFLGVLQIPIVGMLVQVLSPVRLQVKMVLRLAYHRPERIPDASVDAYAAPLRMPNGPYAARETARQIEPVDIDAVTARYSTINVPTLVIWGRHDGVIPLEFGQRLARDIPGARLVVVEDAGHQVQEEQPEPVCRALVEFWSA